MAFEKLRKQLDAEGLLDPRRKRPLPRFPRTVGIVTSTTGAALRDMLTVLRRRAPWTRVVVRSCRVQGEGAAVEVAEAIRALAASGRVDVLIVGRGGGSIEDLWAFNEEAVARAIAACPLPVISAVGHEIDVTIADLVADLRAPTPSAAAEAVVQDGAVLRDALRVLPTRLSRALRGAVERRGRRITDAGARLERAMQGRIGPVQDRLGRAEERMERLVERRLERRRQTLHALAGRLDALSPLAVLGRGYAVALGEGGHVLRRTADLPPGTPFSLRVTDGRVDCRTTGEEGR
jgi:exodeoxyribonuclease VII large subunit